MNAAFGIDHTNQVTYLCGRKSAPQKSTKAERLASDQQIGKSAVNNQVNSACTCKFSAASCQLSKNLSELDPSSRIREGYPMLSSASEVVRKTSAGRMAASLHRNPNHSQP